MFSSLLLLPRHASVTALRGQVSSVLAADTKFPRTFMLKLGVVLGARRCSRWFTGECGQCAIVVCARAVADTNARETTVITRPITACTPSRGATPEATSGRTLTDPVHATQSSSPGGALPSRPARSSPARRFAGSIRAQSMSGAGQARHIREYLLATGIRSRLRFPRADGKR